MIYKSNGGKHTALNVEIQTVYSELTFIDDPDDFVTDDATESILKIHRKYGTQKNICGYAFPDGKDNGKKFDTDEKVNSYIDVRVNSDDTGADKAEVFKTNCLKEFLFPEYPNEKFLGEAFVWVRMARKHQMVVHINNPIYVGNYLEGGLINNRRKHNIASPIGCMHRAEEFMESGLKIRYRIKSGLQYIVYGRYLMKVLVINPIMYTSETKNIKRSASIKDTMMYDFCLAFHEMGHSVTLVGGEPFKPTKIETYPFDVLWWKYKCQKVCMPHCLPFMPETYRYVKQHRAEYDLIITSEVFSLNSLMAYRAAPDKTIIWHELAKHNAIMKRIPSKVWYGIIARLFMRKAKVVARSVEARDFVKKYCLNTDSKVIDHGVNLDKFKASTEKDNSFVVCSQLIDRKKIGGILEKFAKYVDQYNATCRLYIIGEGALKEKLQRMAQTLRIAPNVIFTGKMTHDELLPILSKSKALLVNTVKDNNMISIIEAIAVGTPIVTTDVPLNSTYIKEYQLGIAKKQWDESDLNDVVFNSKLYIENCMKYRYKLSTKQRVEQFLEIERGRLDDGKKKKTIF